MNLANILVAHNYYREPGGEDIVFAAESALLRACGHTVTTFTRDNSGIGSVALAAAAVWNPATTRALGTTPPARVAHFHNTFPLISPSAYYAARRTGAAVVQTLHNYRLICPGALLARDGVPCEDCVTQLSWKPALQHACYRGSRVATTAVVAMLAVHGAVGTYTRAVDAYIALSEFARGRFMAGGLPGERIFVKPNFIEPDPGVGTGAGGFALFVGRLVAEKGVEVLAEAWSQLPDIALRVVGDGPLRATRWSGSVHAMGALDRAQVWDQMRDARVLVFPSTCYENAPLTVLEAFACGTPVIASNLGAAAELVRHGHTGLLFRPGDAADLAAQVRYAFSQPEHLAQMRANARREFEQKYTAKRNYAQLMAIYEHALENRKHAN
jgi:glycosyltransferase involved in cell wall biosynthesis